MMKRSLNTHFSKCNIPENDIRNFALEAGLISETEELWDLLRENISRVMNCVDGYHEKPIERAIRNSYLRSVLWGKYIENDTNSLPLFKTNILLKLEEKNVVAFCRSHFAVDLSVRHSKEKQEIFGHARRQIILNGFNERAAHDALLYFKRFADLLQEIIHSGGNTLEEYPRLSF